MDDALETRIFLVSVFLESGHPVPFIVGDEVTMIISFSREMMTVCEQGAVVETPDNECMDMV